jgi:hypothetical protein
VNPGNLARQYPLDKEHIICGERPLHYLLGDLKTILRSSILNIMKGLIRHFSMELLKQVAQLIDSSIKEAESNNFNPNPKRSMNNNCIQINAN